jgi:hypothetical protein
LEGEEFAAEGARVDFEGSGGRRAMGDGEGEEVVVCLGYGRSGGRFGV